MLYITINSNPSKEKKHEKKTCRAYITFKTQLKVDFGEIWILEKHVPGLLESLKLWYEAWLVLN